MSTTTIRVDRATHAELKRLARKRHSTVAETVARAVRVLRQEQMAIDPARGRRYWLELLPHPMPLEARLLLTQVADSAFGPGTLPSLSSTVTNWTLKDSARAPHAASYSHMLCRNSQMRASNGTWSYLFGVIVPSNPAHVFLRLPEVSCHNQTPKR